MKAKGKRKYFSEMNNYLEILGSFAALSWLITFVRLFYPMMSLPDETEKSAIE